MPGLTFLGLVALIDPPRSGAREAVQQFARAGVKTVMITGDRADTAFAIARKLSIATRRDQCMTGEELDALRDDELGRRLDSISVFAHVSPEHKMRIVNAARSRGSIVAMTGDGVNDAPSLKAADVGIAMGQTGCDVAKNAADIVLVDDNFATIASAISLGRCIYENIRKSILFLLSSNLGEILTMFTAIALGFSSPLRSAHILWINLITDSLPALALGIDAADTDSYMGKKPRPRDESILAEGGTSCTLFYGVIIAAAALIAFIHLPIETLMHTGADITLANLRNALHSPEILARSQTYAFIVLGLSQLFHAVGMRDVTRSIFKMDHLGNKLMILALAVGILLQVAVTGIPYLAVAFGVCKLSGTEWARLFALSLLPLIAHEILVALHREPF
jgi:Ca2+-transporting ATPase